MTDIDYQNYADNVHVKKILIAHKNKISNSIKWFYSEFAEFLINNGLESKLSTAQKLQDQIMNDINLVFKNTTFIAMTYDADLYYMDGFPNKEISDNYKKSIYFKKDYDDPEFSQNYSIVILLSACFLPKQDDPLYRGGSIDICYNFQRLGNIKNRFQYMKWY